jgi:hypothetical protein
LEPSPFFFAVMGEWQTRRAKNPVPNGVRVRVSLTAPLIKQYTTLGATNMKWLIQENLNSERNYLDVVEALIDLQTEFLIINLNHHMLSVVDFETKTIVENSDTIIDEFIKDAKVMVYGGKLLVDKTTSLHLKPGSFLNEDFDFTNLLKIYGSHLLNNEFNIGTLHSLQPPWEEFFIRPTGNNKLFTGLKMNISEFDAWKEKELLSTWKYESNILLVSTAKEILSEARFFIVDKKIAAYSSYMENNTFNKNEMVSAEMIAYAESMVLFHSLAEAYVMDIAQTPIGFKIVEFNNINCSGLYNCNIKHIVTAINNLG